MTVIEALKIAYEMISADNPTDYERLKNKLLYSERYQMKANIRNLIQGYDGTPIVASEKQTAFLVNDEDSYIDLMENLEESGFKWVLGEDPTKIEFEESSNIIYCNENNTIERGPIGDYILFQNEYTLFEHKVEKPPVTIIVYKETPGIRGGEEKIEIDEDIDDVTTRLNLAKQRDIKFITFSLVDETKVTIDIDYIKYVYRGVEE